MARLPSLVGVVQRPGRSPVVIQEGPVDTILWLAVAYAVAFVINVIPAFMPPTWAVLAYFYVHYQLPLLVLTVGGAGCFGKTCSNAQAVDISQLSVCPGSLVK